MKNVRRIDPATGEDALGVLTVREGRLVAADEHLMAVLDGTGLVAMPGLIDVHVHFRDPGSPQAEDRFSGALAAARGGFTRVVTMPNTSPPCDCPDAVRQQCGSETAVRILPSACVTAGRSGRRLADMAALAGSGAVAFTDDGSMVADDALMREAMRLARQLNRPVMDHAMDPVLMRDGIIRDSPLARRLALPIIIPETEVAAVQRDIGLARETGCALHLQHLSCADSVAALRDARAAGLPVTGEATPHHLLLTAEAIIEDDGNWRMNPPLGNRADRTALRQAVLDGTIGILATDHAPHAPETKNKGFARAPFGVIGLETAGSVVWGVGQDPDLLFGSLSARPARIAGVGRHGHPVEPGSPANLVVFDPDRRWTPQRFHSRSANSPYLGRELTGRVALTLYEGSIVHEETP